MRMNGGKIRRVLVTHGYPFFQMLRGAVNNKPHWTAALDGGEHVRDGLIFRIHWLVQFKNIDHQFAVATLERVDEVEAIAIAGRYGKSGGSNASFTRAAQHKDGTAAVRLLFQGFDHRNGVAMETLEVHQQRAQEKT